jgi:hypothetical protein
MKIAEIIGKLTARAHALTAFIAVLYYFEIIYIMISLAFLFGRTIAVLAGVLMSLLLTWHILMLYSRKGPHRHIQLVLMDVHAAYAFSLAVTAAIAGLRGGLFDSALFGVRLLALALEVPGIYLLTGTDAISAFRAPGR